MNRMRVGMSALLFIVVLTACGRNDSPRTASASLGTAWAPTVGRYLTDAKGRAVYMFVIDRRNASACEGACAAAWPPLSASAVTSADPMVRPALIGKFSRVDDRQQTTYNGMPVYYYEDDEEPGDIKGQGKNEFGGLWYLVAPSGSAIRSVVAGTAAAR
jgi:predicted lipoprotein with Yx(FWY)xxD motif